MRIKYKDNKDKYVCKKDFYDGNNQILAGDHCKLKKIKNRYQLRSERTHVKVSGTKKQLDEFFFQKKDDFEYDSKFYDGWDFNYIIVYFFSLLIGFLIYFSFATKNLDFNFSWTGFIIITLSTIILLELLHFFNIKRIQKKFIITEIGLTDILKSKLFHSLPALLIIGILKVLYDVMKEVFNELNEIWVLILKIIFYIFKLFGDYFIHLIIILAVIIVVIIIIYLFMQINLYYTKKYINRGKK